MNIKLNCYNYDINLLLFDYFINLLKRKYKFVIKLKIKNYLLKKDK